MKKRGPARDGAVFGERNLRLGALVLLTAGTLACLSAWGVFAHGDGVARLLDSWKTRHVLGPLACVGLQAFQVVVFFIPGDAISFTAGYIFGTWHALAYSFAGIMMGSIFNFCLARAVGWPLIARIVKPSALVRVDRILARTGGRLSVFLLFLLPTSPQDAMCYGAGLSRMSLLEFALISGAGRLPGLFLTIYLGDRAASHPAVFLTLSLIVTPILFGVFYWHWRSESKRSGASRSSKKAVFSDQTAAASIGARTCFEFPNRIVVLEDGESSFSP